uniref:Uncharacterized protein n=1 Tax=Rhizophora mucronata TaxID=61149 RepID=A0A2P2IIS7_RHIMU
MYSGYQFTIEMGSLVCHNAYELLKIGLYNINDWFFIFINFG